MRISDWSSDVCSSDLCGTSLRPNTQPICDALGRKPDSVTAETVRRCFTRLEADRRIALPAPASVEPIDRERLQGLASGDLRRMPRLVTQGLAPGEVRLMRGKPLLERSRGFLVLDEIGREHV